MTTEALASKTVLISGGSRGIGHAIAVKLAAAGANIVLVAKTDQPHDSLPGTVHTAVQDVEDAGAPVWPWWAISVTTTTSPAP